MYHNPLGPSAATGLGGGGMIFAFTPLGIFWSVLAAFALTGAFFAMLRVLPAALTEKPRELIVSRRRRRRYMC